MSARYWLILAAILASLGCVMSAIPTPTPDPTVTPEPARPDLPTATPARLPTLPAPATNQPGIVLPFALNIRETPNGDPIGKYLYFGDRVTVLRCVDNWCEVTAEISGEEVSGWVFRGCVSSVAGSLMCEDRK